jgi:3-oxoacyl-[acyl-carrier-protein] synthase II
MESGLVPPIINFKSQRDGCDLNYVTNTAKKCNYNFFMSNSFAFGGNNVSVVLGKYKKRSHVPTIKSPPDNIVISGFNFITPHLSEIEEFKDLYLKYRHNNTALSSENITFEKFILRNPRFKKFGRVPLISKVAIEAIDKTITQSGLDITSTKRVGLLFGVSKGPLKTFEKFYDGIVKQGVEFGSALDFPHVVMNSVAGQAAIAFGIKGSNTAVSGQFSPFIAIKYASDLLRKKIQDSIFVCGSDELSECDKLLIKSDVYFGRPLSEGSANVLLETESYATQKNHKIYAVVESVKCTSFSPQQGYQESYAECLNQTLSESDVSLNTIDAHIGCSIYKDIRPDFDIPFLSTQDVFGTLEATTALINLILGISLIQDDLFSYKVLGKKAKTILVSAVALNGNCYSLILKKYHDGTVAK